MVLQEEEEELDIVDLSSYVLVSLQSFCECHNQTGKTKYCPYMYQVVVGLHKTFCQILELQALLFAILAQEDLVPLEQLLIQVCEWDTQIFIIDSI